MKSNKLELNIPDCIGPMPEYFVDQWQSGILPIYQGFDRVPKSLPGKFKTLAVYIRHRSKPEMRRMAAFFLN